MKRFPKKLTCLLLSLLMLTLALTGCGQNEQNPGNANSGQNSANDIGDESSDPSALRDSLTFVTWITHTTYDVTAGGVADKAINHAIFDTLIKFGPNGEYEPMLAESWEETDNGMGLIVHLRDDVTFHDGSPFSADDVIYFFDKAMEGTYASRVTPYVSAYEKVDDYTVKLTKPNVYTNILAFLVEYAYIIPQEAHSKDPAAFNEHPIGAGPYKFVSEEADGSVLLEAYDDYYGEKAGVRSIRVQPPLDASAAVIALETGDADFIVSVPNSQLPLIQENENLTLVTTPAWGSQMLLMMGNTLSDDMELRKAIYYGINRDNALILGGEGLGTVSDEIFAPRMMGDFADMVPMDGYDLEKAKEALANSDYSDETIYITITGNAALAQSIQSDLTQVGLKVEIDQTDTNALLQKLNTGDLDLYLTDMGNSTMTPQSLLNTFSAAGKQIGENMYSTAEYNALVEEIKAMTDDSQLHDKTLEGLEMLRDAYTIVNLYEADGNYAHSADFVYDYPVSAATYVYYFAEIQPAA